MGCATDQEKNDLYVEAVVEFDGQYGPYQMCNPADGWDTSDWKCGLNCIHPSHEGCGPSYGPERNGTSFEGVQCYCDRTVKTFGRGTPPRSYGSRMPKAYPPQCAGGFEPIRSCLDARDGSAPYSTLSAWRTGRRSASAGTTSRRRAPRGDDDSRTQFWEEEEATASS